MSSCCTPDGSCSTSTRSTAGATDTATAPTATAVAQGRRTVYTVAGMTCDHCRATLTKAIGELESVREVEVDVREGLVAVTTDADPDDALIAEVVDDAGYELTGRL